MLFVIFKKKDSFMNRKDNRQIKLLSDADARKDKWVSLDIVVPIYNEEAVLPSLFKTLQTVFSPSNLHLNRIKSVHYLVIDDGSRDNSAEAVFDYLEDGLPASLIRFTRNFGHQNAVSAGLAHSSSDLVAVIDADLQDPPEVILKMISKWREGFDVVYGERKKRKENFLKVGAYWLFYRLLSYLSEIDIPLDSGDFSLMDKNVVRAIRDLPEKMRYHRVMRAWVGFRQTGLSYERAERKAGTTKYSFSKLYKLATDGVASASVRPLRISQTFSLVYLFILAVLAVVIIYKYTCYLRIASEMRTISDELALWFLLCLSFIAFSGFIQALSLYILSGYIGRGYLETKGRPSYIVMEVVNGKTFKAAKSQDETG